MTEIAEAPSRMRRLLLTLLALVTAVTAAVVPGATAGASDQIAAVDVSRYGGTDRYETSLLIAKAVVARVGGEIDWVVLVSGHSWTDAVIAAPLAGSLGAPVLATPPGELRADAAEFLRLSGTSKALLIGANSDADGVGPSVVAGLSDLGITTERVSQTDQYATSVAAAYRLGDPGPMGSMGRTAIVASGEAFADALVAGAFAARGKHPVLLTPAEELRDSAARYLSEQHIDHVVLMGGPAALSAQVEASIRALDIEVTRLAGATRYDTAVKTAELTRGRYGDDCFTRKRAGIARARVPFDSFSAAPLLAQLCAPLLLADPNEIPRTTADYLNQARNAATAGGGAVIDLRVFGGNAAVSHTAIDTYLASSGPTRSVRPADVHCDIEFDDEPTSLFGDVFATFATWSPDCSRIAYVGLVNDEARLIVSNLDGTGKTQITDGEAGSIAWSPDGSRLAFTRYAGYLANDDPVVHLHVVDVDGNNERRLTTGDVHDGSPSWSPDGERIVFSRHNLAEPARSTSYNTRDEYLVAIDADGRNETVLTRGGTIEQRPQWSPDGEHIAYSSDSDLWIMRADGSYPRHVAVVGSRSDRYSWSPDGSEIAFSSLQFLGGGQVERAIKITNLDGTALATAVQYVGPTNQGTTVGSPQWSPDGRGILFEQGPSQSDQSRRVFVASVPEPKSVPVATDCRPTGGAIASVGFPLADHHPSAVGRMPVAVLFVDFPDARASHSTRMEADLGDLEGAETYLEAMSYGALDVQFVPHHRWLRAPHPSEHYFSVLGSISYPITQDAVALAAGDIDFADYEAVVVVLPSSHFSGGRGGGRVDADGNSLTDAIINSEAIGEEVEPDTWSSVLIHEFAHVLGLPDLYDYYGSPGGLSLRRADSQAVNPDPPAGQSWRLVKVGFMGLRAQFPSRYASYVDAHNEMLGWSRWQLGWLSRAQVSCVNRAEATVRLAALAQPGSGVAMAAVPVAHNKIVVVESRRKIGYDINPPHVPEFISYGDIDPDLYGDRVLVYTVDPTLRGGRRPIKLVGDNGFGYLDSFPFLTVGESIAVAGYTIAVTGDDGTTHTVTIVKSD